jgi:hypothetical protein
MLWKRRIESSESHGQYLTVKEHLERDGTVEIDGEISLGNLEHLAEKMDANPHIVNVSCGAGEKLRIHIPKQ